MPLRGLVAILILLDLPFSFLAPWIKNLIGYAAIATAIMAAATWIGGPRLVAACSGPDSPPAQKVEQAPAEPGPTADSAARLRGG